MHSKGACMAGRMCMAWGGMHGRGMNDRGCAWHERWPLQRKYTSYWNGFLWFFSLLLIIFVLPFYREQITSRNGDEEAGDRPIQEHQGKKDVQSPINCSN